MACLQNRILSDGSNQLDRTPEALKDGYIKIDDLTEEEYYAYFSRLATAILFYNTANQASATWASLYPKSFDDFLLQGGTKPHLLLLQLFLKIYTSTIQNDLNKIPRRHLEYFYKNILHFLPEAAKPDKVFLYFELAKGAGQIQLREGTSLTGTDPNSGQNVVYNTESEAVLNQAVVVAYQSLFIDKEAALIFSAPVANSKDGAGQPLPPDNPFWPVFGEPQQEKSLADRTMQDARIGFAFSSPLLLLLEGNRTIEVELTLDQDAFLTRGGLRAWCSGAKGWTGPYTPVISTNATDSKKISFTVVLTATAPPVVPFPVESNITEFDTTDPLLFFEIDPSVRRDPYDMVFRYNENNVVVQKYNITVTVEGLKSTCLVDNGTTVVVPNKPFPLFGPLPSRGSVFKIMSDEVAVKQPEELSVLFDWLDLPFYFSLYYNGYTDAEHSSSITDTNYKVDITAKLNGKWKLMKENLLFVRTNNDRVFGPVTINEQKLIADVPDFVPSYPNEIWEAALNVTGGPLSAFGHREYPKALADQAIKLAIKDPDAVIPNPPYTPTIKDFKLNYKAGAESGAINSLGFYQVLPFGAKKIAGANFAVFPDFGAAGYFQLGLREVIPGQLISLLLVFAEGDMQDDADNPEDFQLQWQYLANNEWKNLTAEQVVGDTTFNWQQSGIISLQIPFDITSTNTIEPAGLFWIRAALLSNNNGKRKISVVHTQAVSATFVPLLPNQADWNGAIPADTIQKLAESNPSIKKLHQPLPSFGGYPAETGDAFFTRVSERLRHKNRAVQYWDYERLILNEFPEIFKVKCLFHTDNARDNAPGHVAIICIPYVKHGSLAERLEPRANRLLKQKVRAYINALSSSWVDIYIADPVYEQILLEFKVRFFPRFDPALYLTRLKDDVYKFLAPWAFEEGQDIVFENRIHRSAIIYFIERLPYVNFITDLKMYHAYEGPSLFGINCMEIGADFIIWEPPNPALGEMILESDFIVGFETDVAIATTNRSILVSAPSHRIEVLNTDNASCSGSSIKGIGAMAVERDFIVGEPC
jgi:hypothetical protein